MMGFKEVWDYLNQSFSHSLVWVGGEILFVPLFPAALVNSIFTSRNPCPSITIR